MTGPHQNCGATRTGKGGGPVPDPSAPPSPEPRPVAPRRYKGISLRLLTAGILLPGCLTLIWLGQRWFPAGVAFALIILIFEWTRLVDGAEFSRGFYTLSFTAIGALTLAANDFFVLGLLVAGGGGALATLFERTARPPASWPLVGAVYLVLPAIAAIFIRQMSGTGLAWTLILALSVVATDSGAYLFGSMIGGPKLAPKLSPGKTWAGAVLGLACGGVVTTAAGRLFGLPYASVALLALGCGLGLAAILGDLLESAAKRAYGVKDTGGAFPGHGGVLDRLDGFLLAAPVLALGLLLLPSDG